VPNAVLATFVDVLSSCRPHFTAPTFFRFLLLSAGWILAGEPRRCVTEALVVTQVSGRLHWQAFHRFFSRATWSVDSLGKTLLALLSPLCEAGWIDVALDDTLAPKKGRHVFGASMHVEPVRSTRQRRNLVHGHCWVVLTIVVRVPWSARPWAVPVLFRLYRGKKEAGASYRTKSVLAREMLDLVLAWLPEATRVRLLLDSGYMNRSMLRGLPLARVTVFGALKTNAALYRAPKGATPKRRGRRRKKGERMATPAKMHRDRRWAWTNVTTTVYQKTRTQRVLSLQAQWYGVLGDLLTRVVVVDQDATKVRVFLCTDVEQTAEAVLELFARRWSVEVWHRDGKQDFGFADSPAWSEQAVRRTAPWAGLLSGLLVVWFYRVYGHIDVPLPERPWYSWKEDLSFADLVRTARAMLRPVELLGWARAVVDRHASVFDGALEAKNVAPSRSTEVNKTPLAA
jgi:DDE superfamily endonuclease